MTDKAKRWAMVYVALTAIYALFVAFPDTPYEGSDGTSYAVGGVIGVFAGGLFGGGIVAFILKFFWKKYTFYELWFASASIWVGVFVVSKVSGVL